MHRTERQTASSKIHQPRKRPRRASSARELDLAFAEPGTSEWLVAWGGLAALSGDEDRTAYDPVSGEVWQYMGAERGTRGPWRHCFRHRCHPRTQERTYLRVLASSDWNPTPL
jgi:hypothetical protein